MHLKIYPVLLLWFLVKISQKKQSVGILQKQVFLKHLWNSEESTHTGVFFQKICRPLAWNFIKLKIDGYFSMNFVKLWRTPFLQDTFWRLLIFRKLDFNLHKFVHSINIVVTLYLTSRNVDFFFSDPWNLENIDHSWCFQDFHFTVELL